jgi:hypothetical protein
LKKKEKNHNFMAANITIVKKYRYEFRYTHKTKAILKEVLLLHKVNALKN